MNSKSILAFFCAAGVTGGLFAEETNKVNEVEKETPAGLHWEPGEGISWGEQSLIATEVGLDFDSKFMSYGLVDNDDPILTPHGAVTLADWVTFEVAALFDTTKYGKKAGYSNRAGRYIELDPGASIGHSFSPEDYSWLPTTVDLSVGYSYEYHPRAMGEAGEDTQFVTFEISLPDLWLEPTLAYERDIDRDNGTYVNLELGHAFALIDGESEEDDAVLEFRPSVAQGIGNSQRTRGYGLSEDHGGLMDTCVKGELTWNIGGGVSLSGYVAYYDYIFDANLRDGARAYEARGRNTNSYNFVAGLSLNAAF